MTTESLSAAETDTEGEFARAVEFFRQEKRLNAVMLERKLGIPLIQCVRIIERMGVSLEQVSKPTSTEQP